MRALSPQGGGTVRLEERDGRARLIDWNETKMPRARARGISCIVMCCARHIIATTITIYDEG